jgi:predicted anti-sigma-YlaC factor YlaD
VNCRGLIREISDYLDGELGQETLTEIELHLRNCEHCRLIVDTTRKTIEIYYNTQPLPLPNDVRERLHQALSKRLGRRPTA